MGERYRAITEIGLDAYERIAFASGKKPGDQRWTDLAIYRKRPTAPADYPGPFMAEIAGETEVRGEERRLRRSPFDSVMKALAWGAFFTKSTLYEELRCKATAWLEGRTETPPIPGAHQTILDRAIELLRKLVRAANTEDDDAIDDVVDEANVFLRELENGPRIG